MDKFWEQILDSARESEKFVNQTGGLPEIWQATENLRLALDQTDREIADAVIAARFPRTASDNMMTLLGGGNDLSPQILQALQKEGEAGFKRAGLAVRAQHLRGQLMLLLNQLVDLRCDLVISQTD